MEGEKIGTQTLIDSFGYKICPKCKVNGHWASWLTHCKRCETELDETLYETIAGVSIIKKVEGMK